MEMPLMKFTSRSSRDVLEFVAETNVVTPGFFGQMMRKIEGVVAVEPDKCPKALIEVVAPKSDLTVFERFQAWNRAFPVIRRTRVAYLVTGRPLGEDAKFFELVAYNRGVSLRFFTSKADAVQWLDASVPAPSSAERRDATRAGVRNP